MKTLDITDIATVATRLRRLTTMNPVAADVGSMAFKSDLVTLLDLIDKLKDQNERSV